MNGFYGVKTNDSRPNASRQRDPAMNPWDTFRAMFKRMNELAEEQFKVTILAVTDQPGEQMWLIRQDCSEHFFYFSVSYNRPYEKLTFKRREFG